MKIYSAEYVQFLKNQGYSWFSSVPCSMMRGIIKNIQKDKKLIYVPAIREDIAVGMAVGAYLGGKKPLVIMQNSGLGNSLDVLISLNLTYKIPLLLLMGWRGYRHKDEIQHWIWGDTTVKILKAAGIPYHILEDNPIQETKKAIKNMNKLKTPLALLLKRHTCIDEIK